MNDGDVRVNVPGEILIDVYATLSAGCVEVWPARVQRLAVDREYPPGDNDGIISSLFAHAVGWSIVVD